MFVKDFVSEIFPAFKSLKFKDLINSPSVCSRQTSHDCAGKCCVFFERRKGFHRVFNEPWRKTQSMENFDVCILLCRSKLLRGKYCCIELYANVKCSSEKYNAI